MVCAKMENLLSVSKMVSGVLIENEQPIKVFILEKKISFLVLELNNIMEEDSLIAFCF